METFFAEVSDQSNEVESIHAKNKTTSTNFVPKDAIKKIQEVLTYLKVPYSFCHAPKIETLSAERTTVVEIFWNNFSERNYF